jgi:hypothetical protein
MIAGESRPEGWVRSMRVQHATLLSGALLVLALAGCQGNSTAGPSTPVVALAPGLVIANGSYDGVTTLASGPSDTCGDSDNISFSVTNNRFTYTLNQPQVDWQPTRVFNVTIQSSGAFRATAGTASIQGKAVGHHMSGDIVGDACSFHFEADSQGTW